MMEIPLTREKITIVDDEDYEWLNQYKWFYRNGYAGRAVGPFRGQKILLMQNVIMGVERGTDHINRNRLDNRRINLRIASRSLNVFNRSSPTRALPRGVYYSNNRPNTSRFLAIITFEGKKRTIGIYDSPEEASEAYRNEAYRLRGEYPPEDGTLVDWGFKRYPPRKKQD